jgi:cytochrome c
MSHLQRALVNAQKGGTTVILRLLLAVAMTSAALGAAERGTPAEARVMLDKAVAHYRAVGRQQALADFTAEKPPFVDRDLYVMCIDRDHVMSANGGFPALVGVSADVLKDLDQKPLGRAIWDAASTTEEGSIRYEGMSPVSQQSVLKITFFRRVGDDICGVGVYAPE